MATKFDPKQDVTDTILKHLEAGTVPWRKPWTGSAVGTMPTRYNGEAYRGINVILLWATALEKDFLSNTWMTFKQAKDLGGNVVKGSKSSTSIKYGTFDKQDTDTGEDKKIPYLKAYRVFNLDQIEGLPAEFYVDPNPPRDLGTQADPTLDSFFGKVGAKIETSDKPQAYYMPSTDTVHMPPIQTFFEATRYYGVLAHEICHWTGATKRLDRLNKFNDRKAYAFEELVAELGACMLAAHLGVEPDFEQSASYLESWIAALTEDNTVIFKAATEAQKAVDYVLERTMEEQDIVVCD